MLTSPLEVTASLTLAISVLLAGRNSIHTWWTGIVACSLFAWIFFAARLYADVTLQLFFVVTSGWGWWHWRRGAQVGERPIVRTPRRRLVALTLAGLGSTLAYGLLLHHFTDAYAPFLDSVVLTASVIGQYLLMGRRIESWWFWLLADSVAVPLYASRDLQVTALLYAVFWLNALFALRYWQRQLQTTALQTTALQNTEQGIPP